MKRHFEDHKEIKSYDPNTTFPHTFVFFFCSLIDPFCLFCQAFATTLRRGVAWIFFYKCMRFHLNIRISSSCLMLLKKTLYTAVHLSLGYTLVIFIIFFDQYILLSYSFYIFFSLFFLLSNSCLLSLCTTI